MTNSLSRRALGLAAAVAILVGLAGYCAWRLDVINRLGWAGFSYVPPVGKTSTAVNLAYEAGRAGVRVLVWDLDPQGAATYLLRVRPKAMTACVIIAGLAPILWSHGTGADVMKRIATPMVGGVITSTVMELVAYPAIFFLWRSRALKGLPAAAPALDPALENNLDRK